MNRKDNIIKDKIITVNALDFYAGGSLILKNITFTVKRGEYLSVIGPNGSGKTTLLKCIDRIYKAEKGEVIINNKDAALYKQKEIAKLIGYVFQDTGRDYPFTVYEFVMMGRYPYLTPFSPPSKGDRKAVQDALRIAELEAFSARFISTLSGGERQRVFIAAALAQGAEILLLDEPTTFLDPKHQDDINGLLFRLNRDSGVTVISVTHDLNSVLYSSDRVLALKGGRTFFAGKPNELLAKGVFNELYEKSFVPLLHPRTGKPVLL